MPKETPMRKSRYVAALLVAACLTPVAAGFPLNPMATFQENGD